MASNRRDFLRNTLLGTGMLATGFANQAAASGGELNSERKGKNPKQRFNMSGYAAPKLDKVRIGFVGLGMRGQALRLLLCAINTTIGLRLSRKYSKKRACQGPNPIPEVRMPGNRCVKIRISI